MAPTGLDEAMIAIYEDTAKGPEYYGESYTVAELGGLPSPGDCIVHLGIPVGADPDDVNSYMVKDVVRRYFVPPASEKVGGRIAIVVQSRTATQDEFEFVRHR